MTTRRSLPLVLLCAASIAGCQHRTIEATPATPPVHAQESHTAQDALDRMDTRVPLPLLAGMANNQKREMRDHLLAVQEIVVGASEDDFATVERAATRIGSSEGMAATCGRMGLGAKGFTEQAIRFHETADTIAEAARRRDRAAVLAALGATLQTCTGCHAVFKQAVVDDATWSRMTAEASAD